MQADVGYERTAEVRVYHNKRDGGLTLASDNHLGAGQILNHCFFAVLVPFLKEKGVVTTSQTQWLTYVIIVISLSVGIKNVTMLTAKFLSIFLRGEVVDTFYETLW